MNIKHLFLFISILIFTVNFKVFPQTKKNDLENFVQKSYPLPIPYNSKIKKGIKPFGITSKSLDIDKTLFVNLFHGKNKEKLFSYECEYLFDEDKKVYKKVFKNQGSSGYIKLKDYYLIEFGSQNDTIQISTPDGNDIPSLRYFILFNNQGLILDKLTIQGNFTFDSDNISCFVDTSLTIYLYNYEVNKDAYDKANNKLKKDAKYLTTLTITQFKIDQKAGKFKFIKSDKIFLKNTPMYYRVFNPKQNPDDPMNNLN